MFGKAHFIPKIIQPPIMWSLYSIILFNFFGLGESGIIILQLNEVVDQFADSELSFAKPLSRNGIEGPIVSAEPPDACTKIAEPPDKNGSYNWMVLIAGNICSYHTKLYSVLILFVMISKLNVLMSVYMYTRTEKPLF
ncbi:UNVERIFIED_CONTAM: hypothetical protein NCL1_38430 [Trichonephila clavipes]